jgi:hypothetical protein
MQMMIPEMRRVGYINSAALREWRRQMSEHNTLIRRGNKLSLLPHGIKEIIDLDVFMLQVKAAYLAELLDSVSDFGERVTRLVQKKSTERIWTVAGQVVIEWNKWVELCSQVMDVLRLLGCDEDCVPAANVPDQRVLNTACTRARRIFGGFACAHPDLYPILDRRSLGRRTQFSDTDVPDRVKRPKRMPRAMMTDAAYRAKVEMAEAASFM